MSRFFCIAFIFNLSISSTHAQSRGIVFQNKDWADVLKIAHAENKFIFIDAYADYCLPCKVMEKQTFSQPIVGNFFNRHFVSYKLDIEANKNDYLVQIYQLKELPALLFLSPNGTLIHKEIGKQEVNSLLQLGNQSINSQSAYKQLVKQILLEDLLQDINHYKMQYGGRQVNRMVKEQVYTQVLQAAITTNHSNFEAAIGGIHKANLPDSDRFKFNMQTLFTHFIGDWRSYFEITNNYLNVKRKTNPRELNDIAWIYYLYINNPDHLRKALQWITTSIQIENEAYNNYTYAALLYKVGAKKKAGKVAQRAFYLAKARGKDTQPIIRLIEKNTKP